MTKNDLEKYLIEYKKYYYGFLTEQNISVETLIKVFNDTSLVCTAMLTFWEVYNGKKK